MNQDLKLAAVYDKLEEKIDKISLTPGADGAQGKDGADGRDGRDGTDGRDGKDGKDGKDGRHGKDGKAGPAGPAGKDGKPGKDGKDGEDGVSVVMVEIDLDNRLLVRLSDGSEIDAGEIETQKGEKGKVVYVGGGGGGSSSRLTQNVDMGTYGFTKRFPVAQATTKGQLCYYNASGQMALVDANSESSTKPLVGLAVNDIADGDTGTFFINGFFPLDNGFAAGDILYISETPGALINAAPTTNGAFVRVMGYVTDSNEIYFDPDTTWVGLEP